MTDAEFARAFERGAVDAADFHHHQHLRLAWVYLSEQPSLDAAAGRMGDELIRFSTRIGKLEKYSDAVTRFWMEQLAAARSALPEATLDEVLAARPSLRDPRLGLPSR